ncbi:MAG: ABC transporter ATP-binding protein, partial [Merdibacter sp.]
IQQFSHQDIDHFTTTSLINRIGNDVNQLQLAVAMLIRLVVRAPFIIIGAIVMAMILDFRLSLILAATVPFIALILYGFIRLSTPLYRIYQQKLDQFAAVLQDQFAGIRVIRAFVTQRREREKAEAHIDDLQRQMMRITRLSALLNPLTAIVLNGAIVILLYQGVLQIQVGTIEPGVIVAFINYAGSILTALVAMSNLIVIFTRAATSAQRVNEVLDHVPSMRDGEDRVLHLCPQEAIRFDHVCFSYGEGEDALSDLDLTIRTGECIGIIGGTGAGKTTMIHLLSRFYDTGKGRVLLYGQDVRTIAHQKLCAEVVSVPQINELFYGTIRENVCFGKKHVSDADIWQALQDAQAADFVKEMKKGLDARVERGERISPADSGSVCASPGRSCESRRS